MNLLLDSTLCQGYGLCQEHAPTLFDIDEWGYAKVLVAQPSPEQEAAARAAVESCPNRALRLEK